MTVETSTRPAPRPTPRPTTATASAGVVERFLARLADWVALDVALSLLMLFTPRPVALAGFAVLSVGYYVGTEVTLGRTPGHRGLGLRVVTAAGGRPSAYQSLLRHLVDLWPLGFVVPAVAGYAGPLAVLAALAGGLGIAVALHRGRVPWPDRLAATRVVQESRLQLHA